MPLALSNCSSNREVERQMRPFRSIVQVLIGRIFVLAMVVLLIALGLQAWWAKAQNEQHLQELMQEVSDTNVPMMALALWDINSRINRIWDESEDGKMIDGDLVFKALEEIMEKYNLNLNELID
jgi:hypothetical protein